MCERSIAGRTLGEQRGKGGKERVRECWKVVMGAGREGERESSFICLITSRCSILHCARSGGRSEAGSTPPLCEACHKRLNLSFSSPFPCLPAEQTHELYELYTRSIHAQAHRHTDISPTSIRFSFFPSSPSLPARQ